MFRIVCTVIGSLVVAAFFAMTGATTSRAADSCLVLTVQNINHFEFLVVGNGIGVSWTNAPVQIFDDGQTVIVDATYPNPYLTVSASDSEGNVCASYQFTVQDWVVSDPSAPNYTPPPGPNGSACWMLTEFVVWQDTELRNRVHFRATKMGEGSYPIHVQWGTEGGYEPNFGSTDGSFTDFHDFDHLLESAEVSATALGTGETCQVVQVVLN